MKGLPARLLDNNYSMKILVTGASGFIGSHLVELLVSQGHDVHAMVRRSSNTRFIHHLPIHLVQASLADPASLQSAVAGVDMVYHLAGLNVARNRQEFFQANQEGTRHLLEATERYAPDVRRFVYLSSLTVVGPSLTPDNPADESWPMRPITLYGESKAAAEEVVRSMMRRVPATIVRAPAVYGERDAEILRFFKMVAIGIAPMIGFDKKLVSLVHAADLVRGYALAAESPKAIGETYFVSSEELYAWDRVGRTTAEIMGKKFLVHLRVPHAVVYAAAGASGFIGRFQKKPSVFNYEKGRDITRRYWICSIEKAKRELGYRPEVSLEEGVERTVRWYRDFKWL